MRASSSAPASSLETLTTRIPLIFSQIQSSSTSHKKNLSALRKIQEQCSIITEPHPSGKSIRLVGEKAFNSVFMDMVSRVLGIKKGVTVGDKVVQFVGKYVAYTTEQGEFSATV